MPNFSQTPKHVAIIMDGNGRWAKQRHLPRIAGHRTGVDSAREMVKLAAQQGLHALTLFAFSSENWQRPKQEVSLLMELFVSALTEEAESLHKNNIRLRIVGDRNPFPQNLKVCIDKVENLTLNNTGLNLNIAANYGGRWDIVHACHAVVSDVLSGSLKPNEINEQAFNAYLCLADIPAPDLFIRTGGEQRISNFLLWQCAYTELYFTDCLWPDFRADDFAKALLAYSSRQRRFGKTSEQIEHT